MQQGGTDQTEDELLDSLTEALDLLNTSDNETEPTETVPQKEEPGFHWLNPEMPSSLLFAARCTHVDNSGQIYLQLETNKSMMKSVHDELTRKHWGKGSSGGRMQEGRECIARWRDNRWYRACVLSYGPFTKHIRSNLTSKDIPIQAIRVVLSNVKPRYGEKWSEECLDHIQVQDRGKLQEEMVPRGHTNVGGPCQLGAGAVPKHVLSDKA